MNAHQVSSRHSWTLEILDVGGVLPHEIEEV